MNEGWKCPNCGKAHAPHVQTCPEPATPVLGPIYLPTYPREFRMPQPDDSQLPWGWPVVTCGDPPGSVSTGSLSGGIS